MKRIPNLLLFAFTLAALLSEPGCKKDPVAPAGPSATDSTSQYSLEINRFIWYGLNTYYLWVDQVPALSAGNYQTTSNLDKFLNGYSDHEKLFYDLLYQYGTVDKWSWIVNDYTQLDNYLQGISKTMGFDFHLAIYDNQNDVLGYVRYVYKGSPAEKAGLKRGDIFIKVNNQLITTSNYTQLLFNIDSYTLGFANIVNHTIVPNDKVMALSAVEMQEDPILLDTIYNLTNYKVGYLVYNGFTSDFDKELNDVFGKFKNEGINRLILDLRYNGGGAGQSAVYLASMIYSTDTTKVFYQTVYNNNLESYLKDQFGDGYFKTKFTGKIEATATSSAVPINNIGMNDVYIITSDNTASASELLINGLKPYIGIKLIGDTTAGKYVGSTTVKDWIDNEGNVNPHHRWAMQPIILKAANSLGVSDFIHGLAPDEYAREDIANLLPLGDTGELLLHMALSDIQGIPQQASRLKSEAMPLKKLADSKDFIPFSHEMYFNTKIFKTLPK